MYTPREQFVLPGISRETAIDLARELGYTVHERDIDLFDAYNADEAFLTSTSLCVCPVRSFNGVELGGGQVPALSRAGSSRRTAAWSTTTSSPST